MDLEESEFDLLTRQRAAAEALLDLHLGSDSQTLRQQTHLVWKVLILDERAQDVLASLLHVVDLRLHNVTLHLPLHSQRQHLPHVTSLYLCLPTHRNLERILSDCTQGLYDFFQLHFLSEPDSSFLQALASGLSQSNALHKLLKVYSEALNFISLEERFFVLGGPSFEDMQRLETQPDSIVETALDGLAKQIFDVVTSMNAWPVIRTGKGASEYIANRLFEWCKARPTMSDHTTRPLLLIVDRSVDLSVMLHHPGTYQALLHDLIGLSNNKLVFKDAIQELDIRKDKLLKEVASLWFPEAFKTLDVHVRKWKADKDRIARSDKFDDLPELKEHKAHLELHTNLSTFMVDAVRSRQLDTFTQVEEDMIIQGNFNRQQLTELQHMPAEDQSRLKAIGLLTGTLDGSDLDPMLARYLEAKRATDQKKSALGVLSGFVKSQIQSLMGAERLFPLTRLVHTAMENKTPDGSMLDTRSKSGVLVRGQFSEAIVFVLGGASYVELHNLQHYAQRTNKRIIYGGTDLPTPRAFLDQLTRLSAS